LQHASDGHAFEGDHTSAAISLRCGRPRFRQMIRHQRGGPASDNGRLIHIAEAGLLCRTNVSR
jgi:hypothetical protein